MDVTVRTLQYYDKEGLLKPSEKSAGGRRLYTKKDMVKLHQIISLKYLGFSLDEIKGKLFSLDNPKKVAEILEKQSEIIKKQIENLKYALTITETLHDEMATKQKFVDDFIGQAIEAYFKNQNIIIPEMEGNYEN